MPLTWLKLKSPTIPSIGEDVEKLELSYTAGGNYNGTTTLEKQFGRFLKTYIYTYHMTWSFQP